jgi:hypothetical protein
MGLKSLMEHLQSRSADTPDTFEKIMGYPRKAPNDAGYTLDTSDTLRLNITREISQVRQLEKPPGPLASPAQFVLENVQKPEIAAPANDLARNFDRWSWPNSSTMNTSEIEVFAQRAHQFNQRGLAQHDAEKLADQLVNRDREGDDRHLCLECGNFYRAGAWRCSQWQRAGLGAREVSAVLIQQLQRCQAFSHVR